MKVTIDGEIILAISNGKWCARKSLNDEDVTIDDNIDDCSLTKTPNPIITTNNTCLTDGICENGTKLNVKVNEKENYDFYVIKDDGEELTLIMNKNLVDTVAWISQTDYEESGGTNYGEYGNNELGPLTALKQLEDLTKEWTNIPAYNYTLEDDRPSKLIESVELSEINYQPIKRTNVKARLPMLTDIIDFIALTTGEVPTYLYENLVEATEAGQHGGYWLSTTASYSMVSFYVHCEGAFDVNWISNSEDFIGLRPVIKISKTA